jgi:hypothetical protein
MRKPFRAANLAISSRWVRRGDALALLRGRDPEVAEEPTFG